MRFFTVFPQQQRRRSSGEESNRHHGPSSRRHRGDDSPSRRRRTTGDIVRRQSNESAPELQERKKFMVLPLRLRDIDLDNPTCLICQEDYELGCTVSFLPCGHLYHAHCINDWLRRNSTCCVCRYELPTTTSDVEDLHDLHKLFQTDKPKNGCSYNNSPLANTIQVTYSVS